MKDYGYDKRQSKIPALTDKQGTSHNGRKKKTETKTVKQLFDSIKSSQKELMRQFKYLKNRLEKPMFMPNEWEYTMHNWNLDAIDKLCDKMEIMVDLIEKKCNN